MGAFTDVYRRHHDLYGGHAYHPTEMEVVRYGKLFNFGIDQGLSDAEKINGARNAIIKTTLPFDQAMQFFFLINEELYKQNSFLLRTESTQLRATLKEMRVGRIQGRGKDYKIGTKKLKDLVRRNRPEIIAAYRARANMRVDKPNLTVRLPEEAKQDKNLYLLCNKLSGGIEKLERELMSFDDAIHTWRAYFGR